MNRDLPSNFRQWHLLGARRIQLNQVPMPELRADQALVRLLCATTCGTDLKVFQAGGHARMLKPPCPFGHEMVGILEHMGTGFASDLSIGDRVVVANSAPCERCRPCQLGRQNLCTDLHYINGAFGEYLVLDPRFSRALHLCPEDVSSESACLAEPLACALHCLELIAPSLSRFTPGLPARAIVMGAGPLGLLLVALLRDAGALVTSVDPNPARLELSQRLGAIELVAYQRVLDDLEAHNGSYDFALDASGTMQGWRNATSCVAPGGEVVLFGGIPGGGDLPIEAHAIHYGEIVVRGLYHHRPELFPRALEWLASHRTVADLLVHRGARLEDLPKALHDMETREVLKVALRISD